MLGIPSYIPEADYTTTCMYIVNVPVVHDVYSVISVVGETPLLNGEVWYKMSKYPVERGRKVKALSAR